MALLELWAFVGLSRTGPPPLTNKIQYSYLKPYKASNSFGIVYLNV